MKSTCREIVSYFFTFFNAFILLTSCSDNTQLPTPPEEHSVELKVIFAPVEVKSTDGKVNLMYSLEIANFEKQGYKLKDFQVLNSENGKMFCTISDTGKYMFISNPYGAEIPQNLFYYPIDAHTTFCFLVDLVLDPSQVPQKIKHKLVLSRDSKERIIEGEKVSVSNVEPIILAAPLKGERFISANSTTLSNNHHPKITITYKGKTTIPERYCIDWNKCDADGNFWNGDKSICENWYVYGQNVYAVAEGEVVSVNDGMPDQTPVGQVTNDLSTFNGTGNSITIYILGGYVTYGHMIKNSITVKVGQRISKGQIIGKVGNSGNSTAPHLHIGFHDNFPYYISEGLPYYFDSVEKVGAVENNNIKWLSKPEQHTNKMVENYGIYNLK